MCLAATETAAGRPDVRDKPLILLTRVGADEGRLEEHCSPSTTLLADKYSQVAKRRMFEDGWTPHDSMARGYPKTVLQTCATRATSGTLNELNPRQWRTRTDGKFRIACQV